MGNYTEINVCFDMFENTPEKIVNILQYLIEGTEMPTELPDHDFFKCDRWFGIACCDSYYFGGQTCSKMKFDNISNTWKVNIRANLQNQDYEIKKFEKSADNVYKLFVKAESILSFNMPAMMLTIYACILGLSWFGANMIVVGDLTTGQLVSLFSYIMNIMMSLMMLSMVFVMVTMAKASAERIAEVIEEKSDLTNGENPDFDVKNGDIDFNNVNFAYKQGSKKYVLQNINLHIKSGETVGIIGGTGSSKSSLVSLISRLYDVSEGEVLVGGKDVRSYDIETLRNEVSVVLQKNVLFSGTIKENLRWGDENATMEEIRAAADAAQAD